MPVIRLIFEEYRNVGTKKWYVENKQMKMFTCNFSFSCVLFVTASFVSAIGVDVLAFVFLPDVLALRFATPLTPLILM